MPKNTQLSNDAVNAQADDLARQLDNGYLRLYTGPQPANSDAEITTQVLLAQLRFSAISALAASAGVLTFSAISSDESADADGVTVWFRAFRSDGTTPVLDGSCGITGSTSNLELASTTITAGTRISITSFTHSVSKSTAGA